MCLHEIARAYFELEIHALRLNQATFTCFCSPFPARGVLYRLGHPALVLSLALTLLVSWRRNTSRRTNTRVEMRRLFCEACSFLFSCRCSFVTSRASLASTPVIRSCVSQTAFAGLFDGHGGHDLKVDFDSKFRSSRMLLDI